MEVIIKYPNECSYTEGNIIFYDDRGNDKITIVAQAPSFFFLHELKKAIDEAIAIIELEKKEKLKRVVFVPKPGKYLDKEK